MPTRLFVATVCVLLSAGCTERRADITDTTSAADAGSAEVVVALPDRPLRFGRPPHLTVEATRKEYEPLVHHLAGAIGHPIELVVPDEYDDVPRGLVAGELDMALLTPLTYVRAKKSVEGLRLLASLLGEGSARYRGYIVASAASEIASLDDLRGKAFAFVDPGSTSGYLFPKVLLRARSILPERDFESVTFAGSHIAVARGILEGRFAGGAISSTTYQHLRSEVLSARLTILAKTAWIPLDAFVTHPSLPESVSQTLARTLLALSVRSAEGRAVLTGVTTTNGFVPGDDRAYDAVRQVAKLLEGDGGQPPADRRP